VTEKGALGIKFDVDPTFSHADTVGSLEGLVTIDCDLGDKDKPSQCRTMCRRICPPAMPFVQFDSGLWMVSGKDEPPYPRIQYLLIGCVGLALELTKANPSLTLTAEESRRLERVREEAVAARKRLIACAYNTVKALAGKRK